MSPVGQWDSAVSSRGSARLTIELQSFSKKARACGPDSESAIGELEGQAVGLANLVVGLVLLVGRSSPGLIVLQGLSEKARAASSPAMASTRRGEGT